MITAEEALRLVELFHRDRSEGAPPINPRGLALAYLAILGSLRE